MDFWVTPLLRCLGLVLSLVYVVLTLEDLASSSGSQKCADHGSAVQTVCVTVGMCLCFG